MDGKVPDQVSTPSLSDGCSTATFSWTAPSNGGLPITKYGWQSSTNDGSTWSAETETVNTSVEINVNYNTNSYVVRVRAFNSLGWGPYSSASSPSTEWIYETRNVTETDTSCTDGTCSSTSSTSRSCGTCGTESGTITGTRTRSRTRTRTDERYTRPDCTSSEWTAISYTSYTDWTYSAWSYTTTWSGSCSEVGVGGTGWVDVTQSYAYQGIFTFAGLCWTAGEYAPDDWNAHPSGWLAVYYPSCSGGGPSYCSGEGFAAVNTYRLYQCSATGAQSYIYAGCWTPPST